MPPVATPRAGKPVQIKGRQLRFSYWPMYRTKRRYGLQPQVYATNPWALIRSGVLAFCPAASRPEALAYLSQAKFFFDAAGGIDEWAAKPLLLYYSFMNLAKAYILTRNIRSTLDRARHGVSEQLRVGKRELLDAYLEVYPSPVSGRPNVFADFWQAISGHLLTNRIDLDVPYLLPQVVAGHRLWCEANEATERFVSLNDIAVMQNPTAKELWLVLHINAGTLSLHGMSHKQLLDGSLLQTDYREVESLPNSTANEATLRFEQRAPITYGHRPSDKIPALVAKLRDRLWAVANFTRPFREYYLYVAPAAERSQVLPQLMSVYAITFYLGSIARYRPQHFDGVIGSVFGGQLQEFLSSQPTQFLYFLASDFAKREIVRAALV